MIRDLKSSKKENTEITCEQKILHKKFIKLYVFEDCQSNSASQELKLCQTSEGFSLSSIVDQKSFSMVWILSWAIFASEVRSEVTQAP